MNAAARPAMATPAPAVEPARRAWHLPALLCGWIAGAALQLQQPALWPGWGYAAPLLLAAGCAWGAWRAWRAPRAGAGWGLTAGVWLIGALLAFGASGLRALSFTGGALAPALEGVDLRVTGVIAALPQPRANGDVRLRLAVESAERDGQPVRLPALVDLTWYVGAFGREGARPAPPLRAGERWRLTVRLKAPHGARNPHGFDHELWLWEQGVQASGYVRASARLDALHGPPERLGASSRYPLEQARQHVRDAIVHALTDGADDGARQRAAGVVAALVTGDQRAIDRADWEVFRTTGVAHLMSISGLHITMFGWLAALVLGWIWRRSARLCQWLPAPSAALVGGVLLAGAYALFSGWGVPAERTVLMLAVVALLRLSGRHWPWPQVWLLACAVVVAVDPWALLAAGFWLSFVAVGILFATDSGAVGAHGSGVKGRFVSMLLEQARVSIALAPLTLLLFGQISVVGLLANLLAIPWVTLLVTPLAMLGVLWAPSWQAAAWCVEWLSGWLQWLAGWSWAALTLAQAPAWAALAAAAGALLLVLRLPWQVRALGLPLLLPALWWQPLRPLPGQFDVMAVDVGQGQAVLVRTGSHSLLYDAGPRYGEQSDAGQQVLVPLLRALGEHLDRLVLSHADSDHVGGALALIAAQPQVLVSGSISPGHPIAQARAIQPCAAGQSWQWDGVRFEVLHPPAEPPRLENAPGRGSPTNAQSCVLRIVAQGGRAALLTGDIARAQEEALARSGVPLAADLLLVPHHGSKTSSSDALLDAVRPKLALVQSGWRNRFGHPAPVVVRRYGERAITLLASPECGAASWSSATAQVVCERERGRRYWHHRPGAARAPADD